MIEMANGEAYFDESGTHDGAPYLCVAGYLFEESASQKFSIEWKKLLNQYSVEYFHMAECVGQRGAFSHLSRNQCDDLIKKIIPIIKSNISFGIVNSVERKQFREIMPKHDWVGDDYQFCGSRMIEGLRRAMIQKNLTFERISYFFESGHSSQSSLNRMFELTVNQPSLKSHYGYKRHGFLDKCESPQLQAADFLAWHANKFYRCQKIEQRPVRKDFIALIDGRDHILFHAGEAELTEVAARFS